MRIPLNDLYSKPWVYRHHADPVLPKLQ